VIFTAALLLSTTGSGGAFDRPEAAAANAETTATASTGRANVDEGNSMPNVVKVAVGSADQTTSALDVESVYDATAEGELRVRSRATR
jgi:hypothetical protein